MGVGGGGVNVGVGVSVRVGWGEEVILGIGDWVVLSIDISLSTVNCPLSAVGEHANNPKPIPMKIRNRNIFPHPLSAVLGPITALILPAQ